MRQRRLVQGQSAMADVIFHLVQAGTLFISGKTFKAVKALDFTAFAMQTAVII